MRFVIYDQDFLGHDCLLSATRSVLFGFEIRVVVKDGHPVHDPPEREDTDGDDRYGEDNLHPVGHVPVLPREDAS